MSRKKQAVKQMWDLKNKEREIIAQKDEEKLLSEEEHNLRIEKLKKLGLIKA